MKFEERTFSKKRGPVKCAIVVYHEKALLESGKPNLMRASATAIVTEDGKIFTGIALCSPADQFCRKTGAIKALGRAASALTRPSFHKADFGPHEIQLIVYHLKEMIAVAKNKHLLILGHR